MFSQLSAPLPISATPFLEAPPGRASFSAFTQVPLAGHASVVARRARRRGDGWRAPVQVDFITRLAELIVRADWPPTVSEMCTLPAAYHEV